PSPSVVSKARLTASLAIITAGSDIDAIVSAAFSASSIRLASGTTRATSPARSASAASIMRPVRQRSIAFALPTARVGRDDEIALHRDLATAAEREARDRRDHRLARLRDAMPIGGEVVHIGVAERLGRHLLDVGAGRKRLVGPRDDHAADARIRLEGVNRGGKLAHQRRIERIERSRPVETDDADLAFGLDNDVLMAHGILSRSQACTVLHMFLSANRRPSAM